MANNIREKIDEHVRTALGNQQTAGLALGLFREGEPIFRQGYGFANLEHQVPVVPDTVFSIGSPSFLRKRPFIGHNGGHVRVC
jgi:CubicO group peptidase (beta-lactamase class C family)